MNSCEEMIMYAEGPECKGEILSCVFSEYVNPDTGKVSRLGTVVFKKPFPSSVFNIVTLGRDRRMIKLLGCHVYDSSQEEEDKLLALNATLFPEKAYDFNFLSIE
ncbi:MAG: hypothetical protein DRH90_21600 [Deltaproteobacteria bacterium]|nr:MAG: hypothetical protein DRH90_21600 [Deltaproteobacteria bacterium]